MRIINLAIVSILLLIAVDALSQQNIIEPTTDRNEFGVDVSRILTFLKQDTRGSALYYRRTIIKNIRLRLSGDFGFYSAKNQINNWATFLGADFPLKITENFRAYVGADFSYGRRSSNMSEDKSNFSGADLLVGARFTLGKYLTISSEPRVSFRKYSLRNSASFDPNANSDEWEVMPATLGLLIVSFGF
jgi:hypothetical protein